MKVALVGTGHVGQALGKGLLRSGHEIRYGSRAPAKASVPSGTRAVTQKEAVAWGDVVILAIPYSAVADTIRALGPGALRSKIVVDATNAIARTGDLAVGHTTSAAEELAKLVPDAKVVKAFNTVFASLMATGMTGGERVSLFVAGDDAKAKETVLRLGGEIGFDPVDAGPLRSARYMEPMAMQMMTVAFGQKLGSSIGLRLVRSTE